MNSAGISYAGVGLPLVTPQMAGFLRSFMSTADLQFFDPFWGGQKANCFAFSPKQPRFELSKLIWPSDASRFSCGLFVAGKEQYDAILAKVDAASPRVSAKLVLGTDANASHAPIISADMFLLNAIQVAGSPLGSDALFLLPLVDIRYFKQMGTPDVWDFTGIDTWDAWFTEAFAGMGFGAVVGDPIHADYQMPGGLYYPLPNSPLLPSYVDSACYTVNRRFVRQFSGTTELMDVGEAEVRRKAVHGQPVITGSRHKDMKTLIPETASFVWYNGNAYDYDVPALRTWEPEYKFQGVRAFYMRCQRPTGMDTEVDAFCERFATELFQWKNVRQDITFPGIVKFNLTGAEDRVEIEVTSEVATTRVFSRHIEFADSLSVRFVPIGEAICDDCSGGGTANCPRVTSVQCTGGSLIAAYDTECTPAA